MTLLKNSRQAVCPECERRVVVPRTEVEKGKKTYRFFCCGERRVAAVEQVSKPKSGKARKKAGVRRSGNLRRSKLAKELAKIWMETARVLPCAACGEKTSRATGTVVEGHHVVRQALIEIKAKAEKWSQEKEDRVLWDLRNMFPLCETCHARHHRPSRKGQRIAWALVLKHAKEIKAFAGEIGLLRRTRREYA